MGIEQLTPHQRAEQALRDIDKLCKPYALTDAEFADAKKDPNIHQSIEIVAAAIEAAVQQEREAFEAHLSSAIDMHRHRRSSPLSNEDTTADAIQKIKVLEKQLQWLRSRSTPPVSADNKEINV